ncbi:MAG: CCA tRNA nucleotidyltransferase [candidate division WOR-3 bacterium]|nr:MAG: CCA tRNA nucleotidyltransferase [candidate division WOR-3 bacterium]
MATLKSLAKTKNRSVLNRIIDFFVNSKYRAYLVGGYVRDSTLGRKSVDIDIVVEGDAVKVAKELNSKLHGSLSAHKEFGTASITHKTGRIDLASARVERYSSPAELPHVYPSTIIEDLNRRDFSINAIAMSISRDNFGEIFDPFNGLQDIKSGVIRVLHKNSFIDDPTRIFRSLRYKNRFGFRIEKKTTELMVDAVKGNMIKQLTGQRILNEIRLIFSEATYLATLHDISDLKIFHVKKSDLERLSSLDSAGIYFYLSKLNTHKFPLTKEEKKIISDLRTIERTVSRLKKTDKNSTFYTILSPLSEQAIRMIPLMYPELKNKFKIFSQLKKIKPLITGSDLKRLGYKPNKKFKSILKKVFNQQLDKKITTKKEAITFLKNQ